MGKPNKIPTMGERHEMAICKERRLETAEQPALSNAAKKKVKDQMIAHEEDEEKKKAEEKKQSKSKKRKKKKKLEVNENDLRNVEALNEEDDVQEGIDWSDSES